MAASVQSALEDVALRLETLKAAVTHKEMGRERDAHQLGTIKLLTAELEALLQPQHQLQAQMHPDPEAARPQEAAGMGAATAQAPPSGFKAARLPATPFDKRRAPSVGPTTAIKAPAATPGGGLPATTPLAAEVLASLNNLGAEAHGSSSVAVAAASAAVHAPAAIDQADGDAAATLSGLFGGLDQLPSGAGSNQKQRQHAVPVASALAALLQGTQLLPPPLPMHAATTAAAAAAAGAGPVLPVAQCQTSGTALLLPLPVAQPRQQRSCNCKRSMCLKMYCECFASGGFCAPTCSCLSCCNTPLELGAVTAAREVVLAKNPDAFEAKVTAAAGHRRGCRCKRSKCLKKYCECFHAGARCNPDVCQCEDCRNTEGDGMQMPLLAHGKQRAQLMAAWSDASPDVLAMFVQPQPLAAVEQLGSGSSDSSGSKGGGRRSKARAQQLPLLPALFPFALPPMPGSATLLESFSAAAMFAVPSLPVFDQGEAAAFMVHPSAAAAAPTFAAAALTAGQQAQLEESMADAVSSLASVAATAAGGALGAGSVAVAATPGAGKVASALTAHLSDMAGTGGDPEMHDTATSPAPHMAIAKLAARRNLAAAMVPTVTGSAAAAGSMGRPPQHGSSVRSRAASDGGLLSRSQGSADENDNLNTAASQRSKRLRRAASGGVLGRVAAEAAKWGSDTVSPPLKRANSLPAGLHASKRGGKVSDRVALLKRALVAETAAAQHKLLSGPLHYDIEACAPTPEDADAISALFELSSSMS